MLQESFQKEDFVPQIEEDVREVKFGIQEEPLEEDKDNYGTFKS